MKRAAGQPMSSQITWGRSGIAVVSAVVVIAGARGTYLLSPSMMNAVALVGAWMMLALVAGYVVARFRPAIGVPVLVGFGVGAIVVAVFAGMTMMG